MGAGLQTEDEEVRAWIRPLTSFIAEVKNKCLYTPNSLKYGVLCKKNVKSAFIIIS
jgi:hypothetical protein